MKLKKKSLNKTKYFKKYTISVFYKEKKLTTWCHGMRVEEITTINPQESKRWMMKSREKKSTNKKKIYKKSSILGRWNWKK